MITQDVKKLPLLYKTVFISKIRIMDIKIVYFDPLYFVLSGLKDKETNFIILAHFS